MLVIQSLFPDQIQTKFLFAYTNAGVSPYIAKNLSTHMQGKTVNGSRREDNSMSRFLITLFLVSGALIETPSCVAAEGPVASQSRDYGIARGRGGGSTRPDPGVTDPNNTIAPRGVSISNRGSVNIDSGLGEIQSTVVPPAHNKSCDAGKLLISNDTRKDPAHVVRVDLAGIYTTSATIQMLPDQMDTMIASNDHDLLTLPSGDVLLMKLGRTRAPLAETPSWFNQTYKISCNSTSCSNWGPGARSQVFV